MLAEQVELAGETLNIGRGAAVDLVVKLAAKGVLGVLSVLKAGRLFEGDGIGLVRRLSHGRTSAHKVRYEFSTSETRLSHGPGCAPGQG